MILFYIDEEPLSTLTLIPFNTYHNYLGVEKRLQQKADDVRRGTITYYKFFIPPTR